MIPYRSLSKPAQRVVALWRCLDAVEQQAIYDLLVHRVQCSVNRRYGESDVRE